MEGLGFPYGSERGDGCREERASVGAVYLGGAPVDERYQGGGASDPGLRSTGRG